MIQPPLSAGLGLKPEHIDAAYAADAPGLWFEVHAENYMVDGGPRIHALQAVRERHPVSLHGVAMSLAGADAPDASHLARLAALVRRIEPVLVSEHLQIPGHDWDEIDFLAELVRRSGCTLLLDLNNVFVSAHNLGFHASAWLDRLLDQGLAPHISEVHLAGHSADAKLQGRLLVDSHDAPVAPPVWALYRHFVERAGTRPTLIERDAEVPAFDVLMAERARAQGVAEAVAPEPEPTVTTAQSTAVRTREPAPCP